MGSIGITPDSKTALSFIGFGGREGSDSGQWLKGGSFIGSRQITDKLNFATEIDYFNTDVPGGDSDWWSVGGWLWTDFTPTVGLARRDYVARRRWRAGTGGPWVSRPDIRAWTSIAPLSP